jgi:5-methylcytosine-specific restriction protein A
MPHKPKRPCVFPGCPELSDGAYCEKHRRQVNREYNRYARNEDTNTFYHSTAWRRLSRLQLKREPLCAECLKGGRVTPAYIADHIQEIRHGGARLDMNNLQSLCKACHNRKHLKKD